MGIQSHTITVIAAGDTWAALLEPHLRLYLQEQADFYHTYLVSDRRYRYASADYRLASMLATTMGLTYGFIGDDQQIRLTAETYRQEADGRIEPGLVPATSLDDEVNVLMFRVGYTVQW